MSTRIVGMFELYARNVDPENPAFQEFVKSYVSAKDSRNPETIPYPQLYAMIREAIREFISKTSKRGTEK